MKKLKKNLAIMLAMVMVIGMQSTIALATEGSTEIEVNTVIVGEESAQGEEELVNENAENVGNGENTGSEELMEQVAAQSAADASGGNYVGDDVYGENGEETLKSGKCGDDVTWVLLNDGTLTISGNGPMWDYVEWSGSDKREYLWDNIAKRVVIEKGVTSVGINAFCYSAIEEVTIPDSVTKIGESAFSGCDFLEEINLLEGLTDIGEGAFNDCSSLKRVKLPEGLKNIAKDTFFECRELTEINIPQSVVSIEEAAFCWCQNLKSIEIPNGVTSIGDDVFMYCNSLTEIRIPSSVTKIGNAVFGCGETPITSIYFEGDVPEWIDDEAFVSIVANAYYPANNLTWTADRLQNYGGVIIWIPWNLYIEEEVTDSVYVKGSAAGATIKCTEELGKFISVAVDGVVVDSSNYTVVEGSTVLTFLSSYLDTLSVGDHVVTLNYTYGSVDTTLTVLEYGTNLNVPDGANGTSTPNNIGNANGGGSMGDANANFTNGAPKTGDVTSLWMLWMCCLSVGVGILAFSMKKRFVA